jgi:hypothetical protein
VRVTLESTDRIVSVTTAGDGYGNEVPGRVWEGITDSGIRVVTVITRIAAHKDADLKQFTAELLECKPPSHMAVEAIPLRLIL